MSAAQALAKTGASDAAVYLALEPVPELDVQYRARIVAEVFSSAAYKIPDLKTSPKPKARRLSSVKVATADARSAKAAARGLRQGAAIGSGLGFARDLANLPPNVCTPTYMGTRTLQMAKEFSSLRAKVLDEGAIKALKMGAFLAVAQGSEQPPRLIVCEYRGARKDAGRPVQPIDLSAEPHTALTWLWQELTRVLGATKADELHKEYNHRFQIYQKSQRAKELERRQAERQNS